jgi:flagellar M-ring protein FliF
VDRLNELIARWRVFYASLPAQRRFSLVMSLAASLVLTAGVVAWATHDPMVALFDQPLDPKTTADVIEQLKTEQVKYRLERGTDRIMVPNSKRDLVGISLRGSNLFAERGTGLEILEENKFGSTRFVEHVRWIRGLQGELERQINGFEQVLATKVLLSIPEDSLFAEDQDDPSASVYVELKSGMTLSRDEGARMSSLVAAAVPGLAPKAVEILDSAMRVIHAAEDSSEEVGVGGKLAELQQHYEGYYQRKVEGILERILGPGNVEARISVELDNEERSIQQRELDGERAVVISSRTRESNASGRGRAGAAGVPGTTANLPELAPIEAAGGGNETSEADEVANIDVPETRTVSASLPGGILSVSAAVVVNGTYEPVAGAEPGENGKVETTYVPLTEKQLEEFRQIVASALGASAKNVSIVNQPFHKLDMTSAPTTATMGNFSAGFNWELVGRYGISLIALLLLFMVVIRPMMRRLDEQPLSAVESLEPLLAGAGGAGLVRGTGTENANKEGQREKPSEEVLAEWLDTVSSGARHVTRDEVNNLISSDIQHSVVTLQSWIREEA